MKNMTNLSTRLLEIKVIQVGQGKEFLVCCVLEPRQWVTKSPSSPRSSWAEIAKRSCLETEAWATGLSAGEDSIKSSRRGCKKCRCPNSPVGAKAQKDSHDLRFARGPVGGQFDLEGPVRAEVRQKHVEFTGQLIPWHQECGAHCLS